MRKDLWQDPHRSFTYPLKSLQDPQGSFQILTDICHIILTNLCKILTDLCQVLTVCMEIFSWLNYGIIMD